MSEKIKKDEETPGESEAELSVEDLEQVTGGAAQSATVDKHKAQDKAGPVNF